MSNLSLRTYFAAAAFAACLPLATFAATATATAPASTPAPAAATVAVPGVNLPDFTTLVDKVGPSVVNIRTTTRVSSSNDLHGLPPGMDEGDMSEFFRRFFGIPMPGTPGSPRGGGGSGSGNGGNGGSGGGDQGGDSGSGSAPQDNTPDNSEQSSGVGSGFIMSADGYVMTNAHVVDDADTIYVTLTDKREFKAKLIGVDERTDVAVVKIQATSLPAITIGDSNKVRVGEWVLAIGSPFGLDNTVTAGIVSAKGRDTGDYLPFIQTDVAVNPGNSGGPLINMAGEVIGINSQIYSRTGGFMGISFAIPIDEAMRVADQLKTTGKVTRGRIAVAIGEVTKEVADSLGLPKAQGALVSSVEAGGPADKAGIQPGDIILKYNGHDVTTATDLPRMVGDTKPGTKATITVWRKGESRDLPITIAEMQPDKVAKAETKKTPPPKASASNTLGIAVSDIPADQKKALKLTNGVMVDAVEGPAARAGFQKGDIILRIGDTDITSAKQFDAVAQNVDPSKMVAVLVRRGDNTQFVPLRPRAPVQK
ncbi:Trypsin-like peptidase domain protein [Caballeronia sp. SBC1]|uniref:DegQ family serine endoprotease n=1 Tax=unclassified Caballeronia TaxID=2646786 RepID=UPI0013E125BF|nr:MULTISPECIES: DegQ family serine endoprotease [unclassified Caballeronia]QIE24540.1 Trypsin-like peptidase domain protein [Caballeronia sp. SBC2]QIN62432.1 Trypsin-like peptidase domain protein [Caballeronia sp. SBC1]